MNIFETIIASVFFQFTLYVALRLAHRGLTLGELGLVSFGGTCLCLEFLNLTIARVRVYHSFGVDTMTDLMNRSGQSQLLIFARIDYLHLYLFSRSP